jgi:hypothetical protein
MTVPVIAAWACLALFIATGLITLLALLGRVRLGGGSREDHRYFVRRLFNALIIETVAIGVSAFAVSVSGASAVPNVVPAPNVTETPSLPQGKTKEFELLRDMSVWDLRAWKAVPQGKENDRVSPAHYLNYLHIRKRLPADVYVAHYATSGAAIDLRCLTHTGKVSRRMSGPVHQDEKEYAIEIDVQHVAVGQEFLVVVEGTYWNAFQKPTETASTYTDSDIASIGELGMIVLFPPDKPFTSLTRSDVDSQTGVSREVRTPNVFYRDPRGQYLHWSVTTRNPNHHYQVAWSW